MQLQNYYWYFQSAIPSRICDEIVKYGKSISDQMAVTGGMGNKNLNKKQIKDLKQKRDSNIVWMNDRWIYKEIQPYVHQANANDPSHGKIRKLSVTVTLSDPKEYKGGELEFDFRNMDPDKKRNVKKCTEILPKGSLVVFPSFVWHRVCPVKSGERNSLVIWNLGWPFK